MADFNPAEGQPPMTRAQAAEYRQVVKDLRDEGRANATLDPARSERAYESADRTERMIRTRGIRN